MKHNADKTFLSSHMMEACAEGSGYKSDFFCGSVISAEDCGLSGKNKHLQVL